MSGLLNSRKNLIALTVVLCLVLLAGGWFLLISPRKQEVADLRAQVAQQESASSGLRAQVAMLQDLQAKLPQQQAALAAMQSKVPNQAAVPELLRVLTAAAAKSNVKLLGVTPAAPAAIPGAAGVQGVDLTLKVSGDYVSLEQYELALEGLSRAFLVSGMTIGESTSGSGSPADTAGATGELSATLQGRVLVQDGSTSAITSKSSGASSSGSSATTGD